MTTIKEAMYFTGPEPGFVKGGRTLTHSKMELFNQEKMHTCMKLTALFITDDTNVF